MQCRQQESQRLVEPDGRGDHQADVHTDLKQLVERRCDATVVQVCVAAGFCVDLLQGHRDHFDERLVEEDRTDDGCDDGCDSRFDEAVAEFAQVFLEFHACFRIDFAVAHVLVRCCHVVSSGCRCRV